VVTPKQSPRGAEENCRTISPSKKAGEERAPASYFCYLLGMAGPKPSRDCNFSYKLIN